MYKESYINGLMNMSNRIKETRLKKGLSQLQLADLAGVTQAVISNLERGIATGTTRIISIANALDTSADWLLNGGDDQASSDAASSPKKIYKNYVLIQQYDAGGRGGLGLNLSQNAGVIKSW